MPTYQITVKENLLSDEQKDKIVEFITKTHSEITGAPNYYVQIIFHESNERRYVAGKLSDSQIWIYGDIRSGRPTEKRCLLINKFVEGVSKITNVSTTDVWVFLNNLEGSDISEWGVILPESGGESEWFNSLPKELQEKLTALAK